MSVTLKIDGMHCNGCVSSVEKAAKSVPGVNAVSVSLETGQLSAELDSTASLDDLVTAIENTGFDVEKPVANP